MKATCFCTYLTEIGSAWRPDDFNAHDFIHAIKDRDINKYAFVRVAGKWHRFDNSNRQDVVGWFAQMVADYFNSEGLEQGVVLVSVPGSRCDVKFVGDPRTAVLAAAVANKLAGATVRDVLRWKRPMPSANTQGGTRDPKTLFDELVLTGSVRDANVVLVDDVLTSGGHLQACAATLQRSGAKVLQAICAGRADDTQPVDPFAIRIEDVPEFVP